MSVTSLEHEGLPIAEVERATGIARATLRIWERRYGFPLPGRDLRGERSYPHDQVRKLRLIADLMARGHRPGRLVEMSMSQLAALGGPAAGAQAAHQGPPSVVDPVLPVLRGHDLRGLLRLLEGQLRELGPAGFITERLPAMNLHVGQAWARGEVQVYEEHLYTEVVQQVLRGVIGRQPLAEATDRPRVLLATFPEESHGIGLLMAHGLLALEGCPCTSLGTRVPIPQIITAAAAFRADVVGLSFAASMNPTHVLRGLEQLRGELPPQVAVWAGGSSPVLARHRMAGVQPMPHIRDAIGAVSAWRAEHATPA